MSRGNRYTGPAQYPKRSTSIKLGDNDRAMMGRICSELGADGHSEAVRYALRVCVECLDLGLTEVLRRARQ